MKILFSIITAILTTGALAQTQTTTVSKTVSSPPTVTSQKIENAKHSTGQLSSVDLAQKTLSLSSPDSASPLRFSYSDETKFSDSEGQALTPQALESGSDVDLTYVQAGTTLIAVKGVFRKSKPVVTERVAEIAPVVTEHHVIVVKPAPAPAMVEETSSTTTTTTP